MSFFGLAAHALAPFTLVGEALSVVNSDGDVGAQSLEQAELIGAECVEFAMGRRKNPHKVAFTLKRNGDFGTGIGLAGHVERIPGDVGSVVHFAGCRDVSDHSGAQWDAMPLAMDSAAANAGEYEFRLLGVAEKQIDFDAAQRGGNFVHNAGDEFSISRVEVIRWANFCRRTNSASFALGVSGAGTLGKAEICERAGGHDKPSCSGLHLQYEIAKISVQILFLWALSPYLKHDLGSVFEPLDLFKTLANPLFYAFAGRMVVDAIAQIVGKALHVGDFGLPYRARIDSPRHNQGPSSE